MPHLTTYETQLAQKCLADQACGVPVIIPPADLMRPTARAVLLEMLDGGDTARAIIAETLGFPATPSPRQPVSQATSKQADQKPKATPAAGKQKPAWRQLVNIPGDEYDQPTPLPESIRQFVNIPQEDTNAKK